MSVRYWRGKGSRFRPEGWKLSWGAWLALGDMVPRRSLAFDFGWPDHESVATTAPVCLSRRVMRRRSFHGCSPLSLGYLAYFD